MISKQTLKAEVIENWNMPEIRSINTGIKRAKGEIVVVLEQDCIPEKDIWLEKLVEPLKDKNVIATVSDLILSEEYWKRYSFLLRLLIINERNTQHPDMDIRACAYRRKELIDLGMISEEHNIGADTDLYMKLRDRGKIVRANVNVCHAHNQKSFKHVVKKLYGYSSGNGTMTRLYGTRLYLYDLGLRIVRGLPFFGLMSILYRFPLKKYYYLLPIYMITAAPAIHVANVIGFWKGFFSKKEKN
jgi:cellulose synthase/poly-beta-1,6-N-acetylglucosamine synthase-like glycosyltransferase